MGRASTNEGVDWFRWRSGLCSDAMKLQLRQVTQLEEALGLAERIDRSAAEFHAQVSDLPYPAGAAERALRARFAAPETVLVVAEDEAAPASERGRVWGLCLTGPFVDPLFGTSQPMVLALHVDPTLRHRGVASELVARAGEVLASRNLHTLAARASHNDDALVSMGERWGFVRSWELMVKE